MTEKKEKTSWASFIPTEEDMEAIKSDAERQAALDNIQFGIFRTLQLIYLELKRANDWVINGVDNQKTTEPTISPPQKTEEKRTVEVAPTIPKNIEEESEIIDFYKKEISGITLYDGSPLPDKILNGLKIAVEEDRVLLKIPWDDDKRYWAAIMNYVRKIGGEWVRDGANSHFLLPKT